MAIKQSTLERKWYYRTVKVFFLVLPWMGAIIFLSKAGIIDAGIFQKNIPAVMQEKISIIVYAILGLIAYYVILNLVWRIFLYIAFGGLERDIIKKGGAGNTLVANISQAPARTSPGAISEEDKKQIGFYLSILIILGIIYYVYFIWKPNNGIPAIFDNGGNKSQCIPTGCGSQWYCSGTYYEDGIQKELMAARHVMRERFIKAGQAIVGSVHNLFVQAVARKTRIIKIA